MKKQDEADDDHDIVPKFNATPAGQLLGSTGEPNKDVARGSVLPLPRRLSGTQKMSCLVDGCKADLSSCRAYHRRHRVCERHSKTPIVIVKGEEKRFCQQCSRFHSLGEFDEMKRSCRKRLDGHNQRRQKSQPEEPFNLSSKCFLSGYTGESFLSHKRRRTVLEGEPATAISLFDDYIERAHVTWEDLIDMEENFSEVMSSYNLGGTVEFRFLEHLDLSECNLRSLPESIGELNSLECLKLTRCSSFNKIPPRLPWSLITLDLSWTAIEHVPPSLFECLPRLVYLYLQGCAYLESLPTSICELKSLECLRLTHCSSFVRFPEILLPMKHWRILDLEGTAITGLPSSIKKLIGLRQLILRYCKNFKFLPFNLSHSQSLQDINLSGCLEVGKFLPTFSFMLFGKILDMSQCNISKIPEQLSLCKLLEKLYLSKNTFHQIPASISKLSNLIVFEICDCTFLKYLPELPLSLEFLDASGCTSLERIQNFSQGRFLKGRSATKHTEFIYYDCLKLVQNRRNWIVREFWFRTLHSRAESPLSHGELKETAYYPGVSICCPGDEIPEWFSHQSVGSSLNMKLPSNWHNGNFLDFALCAVVTRRVPDVSKSFEGLSCVFHFENGNGKRSRAFHWEFHNEELHGRTSYTHRTEFQFGHLCMWYKHEIYDDCLDAVEVSFNFYANKLFDSEQLKYDYDIDNVKIMRCGVRLLYLQDAPESAIISRNLRILEKLNAISDKTEPGGSGTEKSDSLQNVPSSASPRPHSLSNKQLLARHGESNVNEFMEVSSLGVSGNLPAATPKNSGFLFSMNNINLHRPRSLFQSQKLTEIPFFDPNKLQLLPIQSFGKDYVKSSSSLEDWSRLPPLSTPQEPFDILLYRFIEEQITEGKLFETCFQHARIPDWCSDWSSKSSIQIQLSPEHDFHAWKGIVLFFTFVIKEHDNSDDVWESKVTFCNFKVDDYRLESLINFESFRYLGTGSFGICCYIPRQWFRGRLNKTSSVIESFVSIGRPNMELKCGGLRLIFEQDVEEFTKMLVHTVKEHRDQVLNFSRHCKRLLDGAKKLESINDMTSIGDDLSEGGQTMMETLHEAKQGCPAIDISTSTVSQGFKSDATIQITRDIKLLFSTLFQGHYARENHMYFDIPLRLCSPWFFHHSVGDTAICYLPPGIYDDDKWVGLELYVVFKQHPTVLHSDLDSDEIPSLLLVDAYAHGVTSAPFSLPMLTYPLLIDGVYGSHSVFCHVPRACFSQQLNQCQGISILFRPSTPDLEVEMCGTKLLYEQDLEPLTQAIIDSTQERQSALHLLLQQAEMYVKDETSEREAVKQEVPHYGLFSSSEREQIVSLQKLLTSTEHVAQEVRTLLKYRYRPGHNQAYKKFDPILLHSKLWSLENSDRGHINEAVAESSDRMHGFNHLHIMIESLPIHGSGSMKWGRNLEFLIKELSKNHILITISFKENVVCAIEHFDPCSSYNLCFPGKKILDWFKRRNSMSMVGTELPPDLYNDNNWKGLVICAAFYVHDDNEQPIASLDTPFKIMCHFKAGGCCLNPVSMFAITKEKLEWLDHGFIWITYLPRAILTELKEQSYVIARIYSDCTSLMVKTCGIHLLYQQEVEEFKQTVLQYWTSSFGDLNSLYQLVPDEDDEILTDADTEETSGIVDHASSYMTTTS